MTDAIDHACSVEAKFTEMAVSAQLKRAKQSTAQKSEQFCRECGDEIPQARRNAVPCCKYCIECQEIIDKGML
ncbi:TPA: TraR/DksA C4-type zinc finger protein [Vibrio parahaemolyticus]|uniref:TraR/DksA C4-type zinc finger protein n=1 Tax=Vibrio parahaemolyticus TaxID=670 RepID=UPI0003A1A0B2|nr:TraR/DksA C4-type zinc finger protein [Vibrio parahaemolyticus]MBE4138084.1 TraR/DksA family transcriptional regulator [Vibrio parahaemolyticus]MQF42714.1 TraR/DksA family transcriptional regulator [Vibrio parahaemolyticus]TOZ80033.1 TraR/DksA family transcriptional regulator [Vibrio parahaemolyticus]TOZ99753.1 TraR/DksA family transcriptional regulator [Vibrio parahaemolyticus]HCE1985917.1 TraR/DksA C4-type zinc finger protein [Vibrio parahaemolyticus]